MTFLCSQEVFCEVLMTCFSFSPKSFSIHCLIFNLLAFSYQFFETSKGVAMSLCTVCLLLSRYLNTQRCADAEHPFIFFLNAFVFFLKVNLFQLPPSNKLQAMHCPSIKYKQRVFKKRDLGYKDLIFRLDFKVRKCKLFFGISLNQRTNTCLFKV